MSRFTARRVAFGKPTPAAARPGDRPHLRAAGNKRVAMLREASDVLANLPGPGEELHAVMTGRYDLMHLVVALMDRVGERVGGRAGAAADRVRIATLSYNGRNLAEMLRLLDEGKTRSLTLLCSAFFRDHNKELWEETREEFAERGQWCAADRSHAKVVTLSVGGFRYVIEGSANLRTNGNREQFLLVDDRELHDWHAAWIDDMVSHASQANQ